MSKQKAIKFIKNFPLRRIIRFGVGGPARHFSVARTEDRLISLINYLNQLNEPLLLIGEGTNLVADDRGVNLTIIQNKIEGIIKQNRTLTVGAGVNLNHLISYCCHNGLKGLEKMAGIPGSVGGAVAGNAGAYGQEIKDCVISVKIYDGYVIRWLPAGVCGFTYRKSIFSEKPSWFILAARLRFRQGKPKELKKIASEIRRVRKIKYPTGLRCAGSYFKNIVLKSLPRRLQNKLNKDFRGKIRLGKLPAGVLIEATGLCGKRIGNIKIADWHGNLIVNLGGGKAKDILALAALARQKVYQRFGVKLEEEVRIIS